MATLVEEAPKIPVYGGNGAQIMGSYFPNKNHVVPYKMAIVALAATASGTATPLTVAGTFELEPGASYELVVAGNTNTVANAVFFQLMMGDTTQPVAGDFTALPAAGVAINGYVWPFVTSPTFILKALTGQRLLTIINRGLIAPLATYIAIRKFS